MYLLLTLAVSTVFGLLLFRLKVPGGGLVGAMLGTLLLTLSFHCAEVLPQTKFVVQVMAGAFLGCSMEREDFVQFKSAYRVVLAVLGTFFLLNLLTGWLLIRFTVLTPLTALLSAVPGGLSDVVLSAADMGAEVSQVTLLQFVRLLVGIGLFPSLAGWVTRRFSPAPRVEEEAPQKETAPVSHLHRSRWWIVVTLLVAVLFGYGGKCVGIPAGTLIFTVLGTMLVKMLWFPLYLPKWIRRVAQILSGTYIGCSISEESLHSIPQLLLPTVIVVTMYLLNMCLTGYLLHRCFSRPLQETMLMVIPAGAADMALISADLGVQSSTLILVHIFRMLTAAVLFPQICHLIAPYFA